MIAYFSKHFRRVVIQYEEYSITILLSPSYDFNGFLYLLKIPITAHLKYGENARITDWKQIDIDDNFTSISSEVEKYL